VLVTWSRLNAEANSANLRKLKGESTDQGDREWRSLLDQLLRTPISFMGAYEAARQFAAPEILPHIISRLDRIDRELENPWL
jgi:hypothetical protein